MGTYWWVVDLARREAIEPNSLDCAVKHLDRSEYWERRNEVARAVEWLLVTRRWKPEDVWLISDMDQFVPIGSGDYSSSSRGPAPDTSKFADISLSVREQMAREPLPIPTRAVLECKRGMEVTTVFDDRGAVLRRLASDGILGSFLESDGVPLEGEALDEYAGVVEDFWFYEGVLAQLDEWESTPLRVTIVVGADRWKAMVTGADVGVIATEGGTTEVKVGDLTELRHGLPEAFHGLVEEIEITLHEGLPRMYAAIRRSVDLRGG
jgi:hypothetical protein